MKNRLIALLTTASLGLLPMLLLAQEETPQMNNLSVTDLSVATAIISWTTDQKTIFNKVLITSADSSWEVSDEYGSASYAHLVQVTGLELSTTYTYSIESSGTTWDNNGDGYSFTTLGIAKAGNPRRVAGTIESLWGSPVDRCLIRYWLYNEYDGLSLPRVTVSDIDGGWTTSNLGIMYNSTGTDILYPEDPGEILIVEMTPNYWSTAADTLQVQSNLGTAKIQVIDPNAPGEPGDVDGNGAINIFDLLDLLKVLSGRITPDPQQLVASDLDANGKIDIFDLLELLKKMKTAKA